MNAAKDQRHFIAHRNILNLDVHQHLSLLYLSCEEKL